MVDFVYCFITSAVWSWLLYWFAVVAKKLLVVMSPMKCGADNSVSSSSTAAVTESVSETSCVTMTTESSEQSEHMGRQTRRRRKLYKLDENALTATPQEVRFLYHHSHSFLWDSWRVLCRDIGAPKSSYHNVYHEFTLLGSLQLRWKAG